MDHQDHEGSRDGKKGGSSRDTMASAFHIRLTAEKVVSEEWISGSVDQQNIDPPELLEILKGVFVKGSINYEMGKGGQKHFQCTVIMKYPKRKRASWVQDLLTDNYPELQFPVLDYCKKCRNKWASDNYTQKSETAMCDPWVWGDSESRDLKLEDLPEEYPWQDKIVKRYEPEAPTFNADIHWYYDEEGQIGKTMTGRFLVMKQGFYILSGGKEKMRHLAAKHPARGYIFNITRDEEDKLSYAGLEQVSDQMFADTFGSEMSGMIVRRGAHVVVFANFSPNYEKLSRQRWKVWRLRDDKEDFDVEFDGRQPGGDPRNPRGI